MRLEDISVLDTQKVLGGKKSFLNSVKNLKHKNQSLAEEVGTSLYPYSTGVATSPRNLLEI